MPGHGGVNVSGNFPNDTLWNSRFQHLRDDLMPQIEAHGLGPWNCDSTLPARITCQKGLQFWVSKGLKMRARFCQRAARQKV
jgi:hypothetical protein